VRVALFVTCLVDQLFPNVAEATVSVLRRCGIEPELVLEQTCCGQIAFNDGFWPESRTLARRHLDVFEQADAVVTPSGSCAAMVREFYPVLLKDDPDLVTRAHRAGHRTYELSEFLVDVLHQIDVGARFPHRVAYHASCHGLRGLGVRDQPVQLLTHVRELDLMPLEGVEECCGFGGMFAVKFSALSGSMLDAKIRAIETSEAEVVTATDASCLMHIDGGLRRRKSSVRAVHLAEILADT
jgi:L-lactate dehydrogenase complex protein LldE